MPVRSRASGGVTTVSEPRPPADNVYKIIVVFGLIVFVAASFGFVNTEREWVEARSQSLLPAQAYLRADTQNAVLLQRQKTFNHRVEALADIAHRWFIVAVIGICLTFLGLVVWLGRAQEYLAQAAFPVKPGQPPKSHRPESPFVARRITGEGL